MNASSYRDAIIEYIRAQAKPVDKFSHQPRLYALAVQVGEGQVYDDDVLFAAAWLHDLGVFVGHRPEEPETLAIWDNVAYSANQTPEILAQLGFPQEKIPAVVTAIRSHLPSANPTNVEGVVLRDADILEQLGAIAVLRTVCKIGRDTRFHTFADAVAALQRSLEKLPSLLRLPRAQELARPRVCALRHFLAAVEHEAAQQPL